MDPREDILAKCRSLIEAYDAGKLGFMKMPEDASPEFSKEDEEQRLVYFTLPMSLNYQRDSYKLWEACLKTFNDDDTKKIFDIETSANMTEEDLRKILLKHKIALQPNKHITTWKTIAKTIHDNWGNITGLLKSANHDFLKLQNIVQKEFKKGFPYLSGPKIFHYWCFILQEYGGVKLKNSKFIEIAPDTHIRKCSLELGIISEEETEMSADRLSQKWRELLDGSGISPIDMHPPLWFWSRNNFQFKLP